MGTRSQGKKAVSKKPPATTSPPSAAALSIDQLAELLTKGGGRKITAEEIRGHVAAGAPSNGDGTIHLVHFAAWLAARIP